MRQFIVTLALLGALAGAAPGFAADTPASAPIAGPAAKPAKPVKPPEDPDRVVCTREHVVGSNRPQKVCMTVAERERLRDAAVARSNNNRGADFNTEIGGPGR